MHCYFIQIQNGQVIKFYIHKQFELCKKWNKGPFIISTGGGLVEMGVGLDFSDELKGGPITFLMSWKGGVISFLFFKFKSGFLCLTIFLLQIWCIKQCLAKMGNEIAHLMPTKYKIFLGKEALPPCSQTVLPTIQNGMMPISVCKGGKEGGRTASLIFDDSRGKWASRGNLKLVEAWNIWWKWYKLRIHYKIMWILPSGMGFLGLLKHSETHELPGALSPDPRCHNGMKIVQIDNSVQNYMWILPLILPPKTGFLGF